MATPKKPEFDNINLSLNKLYDIVKYCALTTYGTYSSLELLAQAQRYTTQVTPAHVEYIVDNLEKSTFIYKADSIPAPVYVTIQPELWVTEARTFFANLRKATVPDDSLPSGVSTSTVTACPPEVSPTQADKTGSKGKTDKADKTDKKNLKPVKPTNSTATVVEKQETKPQPKAETVTEVVEAVKQEPPMNRLKQRWYEAHKER